jgi:hypothetical protein
LVIEKLQTSQLNLEFPLINAASVKARLEVSKPLFHVAEIHQMPPCRPEMQQGVSAL